jgi:type II secretory pathway component PulM
MSEANLTNQEKLEEVYKLTLENNHLLHSMRNRERVANAFRIVYWLVIILSLAGAYYYVRPVVEMFTANQDKIDRTLSQFEELRGNLPEARAFDEVRNALKGLFNVGVQATTTGE